jgi:hypothetical protein
VQHDLSEFDADLQAGKFDRVEEIRPMKKADVGVDRGPGGPPH